MSIVVAKPMAIGPAAHQWLANLLCHPSDATSCHLSDRIPRRETRKRKEVRKEKRKSHCRHGCPRLSRERHESCRDFMNALYDVWSTWQHMGDTSRAFVSAMMATRERYIRVWSDYDNRATVKSFLVSAATEMFVTEDGRDYDKTRDEMSFNALWIAILERYDSSKNFDDNVDELERDDEFWTRHEDIVRGYREPVIRFYFKQIPCSCLDETYAAVRSRSKVGWTIVVREDAGLPLQNAGIKLREKEVN